MHYRLLIEDSSSGQCASLRHGRNKRSLPVWEDDIPAYWQEVSHIVRHVRAAWGIRIFVRRAVSLASRQDGQGERRYEAELVSVDRRHDSLEWIGLAELNDGLLADEEDRQLVSRVSEDRRAAAGQQNASWLETNWYSGVVQWLRAEVFGPSEQLTRIEQLRAWQRSCVLRLTTEVQSYYFKACPRVFAHEIDLLRLLSTHVAPHVPQLVACDPDRLWMVMESIRGRNLKSLKAKAPWLETARGYSHVQKSMAPFVEELVRMGCPVLDGSAWKEKLERATAQWATHDTLRQPLLTAGESLARLADSIARLHDQGAPLTLDHGDFWAGQVICREGNPVFLDWSDACVTQPWLGIMHFLDVAVRESHLAGGAPCRAILAEYLNQWTNAHPARAREEAIRTAWRLSSLAKALYHASGLVDRLDPCCQWELYPAIAYYLNEFHIRCQLAGKIPWE
jgi:tRNA A-37 threonylcarbamoyl transferase component Bud32